MDLYEQITRHEGGNRLRPYLDCCGRYWRDCECGQKGKLTVGIGRNLEDNGISAAEGWAMFQNDIKNCRVEITQHLPWADRLDEARYAVLINLCFNMGVMRLLGFHKMLAALRAGNYQEAHDELLESKYAGQVGGRAEQLARQLLTGQWQRP